MKFRLTWVALSPLFVAGCAQVLGLDPTTLQPDSGSGGSAPAGSGGAATMGSTTMGSGGGGEPAIFTLMASPPQLTIAQGAWAEVTITLSRPASARLNVALSPLPKNGVSINGGTIEVGGSSVKLTVMVDTAATIGRLLTQVQVDGAAGLTLPILISGKSGTPDVTLSGQGIITDSSAGSGSTFYAVLASPDRSIVAGGVRGVKGGWTIKRYLDNGNPDQNFNANAAMVMPMSGELRGLARDLSNDDILAVGFSTVSSTAGGSPTMDQATVVRLHSDGTPEMMFGSGGVYVFDSTLSPNGSKAYSVAVTGTSKILVAGSLSDVAYLTRLTAAGSQDSSFQSSSYKAPAPSVFKSVTLAQDAQHILVGGTSTSASLTQTMALRTTETGAPDVVFNNGAIYLYNDDCEAKAIAPLQTVTKDQVLVLVGQKSASTSPQRSCASGIEAVSSKRRWGPTSKLPNDGIWESFNGVTTFAGDRAVVVGNGIDELKAPFSKIIRISIGGDLDKTFANSGILKSDDAKIRKCQFNAVALDPDGRIVVAGSDGVGHPGLLRFWP